MATPPAGRSTVSGRHTITHTPEGTSGPKGPGRQRQRSRLRRRPPGSDRCCRGRLLAAERQARKRPMLQQGGEPAGRLRLRGLAPVLTGAVLLVASCAPPTSPSGSGDGGVAVSNPAAAQATAPAPVDVVLGDTAGLAAPMTLYPFADNAAAGDVTFRVKNVGTVEHELIVLKTDTPFDQLPVADSGDPPAPVASGADKVDEANNVAETGDPNLRPGDSRTFTAKGLSPGHYVLVCNLAKHYGLGMRAAFTVTAGGAPAAPAPVSSVSVSLKDSSGLNGPMSITPSATVGSTANITFTAKNDGTVDHELLVIKTDTPFDQIPIADSGDPPAPVSTGADKIDEANNIAETGDPNLKPGESRTFG